MTAENRLEGWSEPGNSEDYSVQQQEEESYTIFKEIVNDVKNHAEYLENEGVQFQMLFAALQEFVLRYYPNCKVFISDNPPQSVILSLDSYEAVVHCEGIKKDPSELQQAIDAAVVYGLVVLMQLDIHRQQLSEAANKVRELLISKEQKCVERVIRYTDKASWNSSFETLLEGVKKRVAADCPDAHVETNELNDIFVVFGEQRYRVFTNSSYPYPDQLFPLREEKKEKPDPSFDPNLPW